MLTGDNERTAKAIGAQAGVDEVIAGFQLLAALAAEKTLEICKLGLQRGAFLRQSSLARLAALLLLGGLALGTEAGFLGRTLGTLLHLRALPLYGVEAVKELPITDIALTVVILAYGKKRAIGTQADGMPAPAGNRYEISPFDRIAGILGINNRAVSAQADDLSLK